MVAGNTRCSATHTDSKPSSSARTATSAICSGRSMNSGTPIFIAPPVLRQAEPGELFGRRLDRLQRCAQRVGGVALDRAAGQIARLLGVLAQVVQMVAAELAPGPERQQVAGGERLAD